ncbi:MAG: peptide deformylase [bacterium]|nr:peptide deformylase [bacterium]
MAVLKIITNPHPTLRIKAEEINLEELKDLQDFIKDMEKTMVKEDGLGLAANQVDFPKRIFVINTKEGPLAIINPTLHKKSFKKKWSEEGCLSVPETYGQVKRHEHLTVKGFNKKGKKLKMKVKGLFSRVVQHEVDHLDGILFIDKAKKIVKHDSKMNYENL